MDNADLSCFSGLTKDSAWVPSLAASPLPGVHTGQKDPQPCRGADTVAHTFALSFFSVCARSTELVDWTSLGSSVSASSVPKACSI